MTDGPFDAIVVGGGGSGLAAAVSVAERGGSVLLLEKQPQLGGTTGIAIGSFTAAGTAWQQRSGIRDSVDDHADDAGRFAPPAIEAANHAALRREFLAEAAGTLQWLAGMGLSFVGPSPEPPNRVPRMHNVVPGAKAYVAVLHTRLLRLGGRVQCNADVQRLLLEHDRIAGVSVFVDGRVNELCARRGVVLAAGDYASSAELIARHRGEAFRHIEGINPHATGDGHRLVEQAGGQLRNMAITYGPELRFVAGSRRPFQQWLPASGPTARLLGKVAPLVPRWLMRRMIKRLLVTWQHPENALFDDGAILVNRDGRRFVDERASPAREIAVARQPGKFAYLLLDSRLAEKYSAWPHFISTAPDIAYAYVRDYLRLRPDVAIAGSSLEQLAGRRGIPVDSLRKTIDEFNAYVASGQCDSFGRSSDEHPLSGDRWVLLGPVKSYFTTTEGGAAIDGQCRVLDAVGEPIAGLFAVGQNGLGGMILWGHGLHIAWAMTSGRRAGRVLMEDGQTAE